MRFAHLTAAEIQAYAARQVRAEQALKISDHLLECGECRAVLRQAEQFRAPSAQSACVSYEELADLVDAKLDPLARRGVMERLARSPAARAELNDLAAFKREVARTFQRQAATPAKWRAWSLPLAAVLVAGVAFLWWSVASQPRGGGLVLRDNGVRLQITADGSLLGGPDLPAELRSSLKLALAQKRFDVPANIAALRGMMSNLAGRAGEQSTFSAVTPIAIAVEGDAPELRWTRDSRATAYRITVARRGDDQVVATTDAAADQLSWRVTTPLRRGDDYAWQVQALQNGDVIATAPAPPQPPAQFHVLSATEQAQLAGWKQGSGKSHLGVALAYARAGVLDKADAELAQLERENRASPLPAQLRAALR